MEKREISKDVEIGGRKFRISKFDALTGSYIAYKVMTQMLPMLSGLQGSPDDPGKVSAVISGLMQGKASMSKADFIDLQRDCLSVCSEVKMVGSQEAPVRILLENGSWGVEGLENDVSTVLMLTVHALFFNLQSFFDVGALEQMRTAFPVSSPPSASMSTSSPMGRS